MCYDKREEKSCYDRRRKALDQRRDNRRDLRCDDGCEKTRTMTKRCDKIRDEDRDARGYQRRGGKQAREDTFKKRRGEGRDKTSQRRDASNRISKKDATADTRSRDKRRVERRDER